MGSERWVGAGPTKSRPRAHASASSQKANVLGPWLSLPRWVWWLAYRYSDCQWRLANLKKAFEPKQQGADVGARTSH
jgi:hypothetical protein